MLAYDEIIEFIATTSPADRLASFRPSREAQARVEDLLDRNRTTGLSNGEAEELDRYLQLDQIMTLVKARARLRAGRE